MSELALLRDWTAAEPTTTAEDRRAVMRLFVECGKATLDEITPPELEAFYLRNLPARAGTARKMYDRALPAFFAWADAAATAHVPLESAALLRSYREYRLGTGFSPDTMRVQMGYLVRFFAASVVSSHEDLGEDQVIALLKAYKGKPTARQSAFFALKSFFAWACRRGQMPNDPTADMKVKGPREKEPDAFSPAEIVTLLDAAALERRGGGGSGKRHAAAILLAYSLGLRRSEVVGITMEDVDLENDRVHIRATIAKGGQGRYVEMNQLAHEAVAALRPWSNGTLVGTRDPAWFTMMVNEVATRAGFPPGRRNAHLLRSSFATNLLREGVPVSVVSKLLGHSKISTTSRYLAVVDLERHAAVATMKLPRGHPGV
jgi:integrase/recombinase XerC